MNQLKVIGLVGLAVLFLFAYQIEKADSTHIIWQQDARLSALLESAQLRGVLLIYDSAQQQYFTNDSTLAQVGQLPASTFKIPNSIIALETEIISSDSTLIPWDGTDRYMDRWEQDLTFSQAFHYSCVPCYQDIARQVGVERMKHWTNLLTFGKMDVDSSTIDRFWLRGRSRISPIQQIDFLQRLYHSRLPISSRTDSIMKHMMIVSNTDGTILRGKTGWSNENNHNNGWYVGYTESSHNVIYFATNISPTSSFDMNGFASARVDLTYKALKIIQGEP